MTKTFKSFAIAMLVTGATVTATRAPAAVNTNTFTNVIQTVSITLTAYSNAVPASTGKTTVPVKPVAITSKSIIAALSNDAAFIPALSNFNFGKAPQLVLDTVFALSNTTTISQTNVGAVFTNSIGTNDNGFLYFTVAATNGTNVITITNATSSLTISNNTVGTNGGTNVITAISGATDTTNFVLTNVLTFTNMAGATNATFPTNVGVWTVISTSTNSSGTNISVETFTNVSTVVGSYVTNSSGIEVEGGTAASPTFADVSSALANATVQESIIAETGVALGTSNQVGTSKTTDAYGTFTVSIFSPNSTATGNNISLSLDGFVKAVKKLDVLHQSKAATNVVTDTTSSATVAGYGSIGGIYSTNTNVVSGLSIALPGTNEVSGTNALTTGTITNVIPVVVSGTITVGSPKSVAQ